MTCNFWVNKSVLITGHTGFKGSWLSLWLETLGAKVIGLALPPPTNPSLFEVAEVGNGIVSNIGDVRDFDVVYGCIKKYSPEIILHLAAQPLVQYSYLDPIETYSTNVIGTINVLEAARLVGCVRAFVNVTTDKCYENKEWIWPYRENDALGGFDPYSSSKACSELLTASYRRSYFLNTVTGVATARAGNVIGGGDWSEGRLVPDFFRSVNEKSKLTIRNPLATRPWQHVLEPLSGYLKLAECLYQNPHLYSDSWNFGPEQKDIKTVRYIADQLVHLWGRGASWELDHTSHPHEAVSLALDASKARYNLGWVPLYDLNKALEITVNWELDRINSANMKLVTVQQIEEFKRLARPSPEVNRNE